MHMSDTPAQVNTLLVQRVQDGLKKVDGETKHLKNTSTRLTVGGLFTSAAATFVAGWTAMAGPIVGEGIPGWRLACIVAAIFALLATILSGLEQQLKFSDRLAEANQCLARLRALELNIATGRASAEGVAADYEDILKSYPGLV
jgi:hypothetical protein